MQHIASDTSKNRIKRSKYASNYEYRVREAVPIISFIKRMEDIAMIYDFAVTTGKGAQLNLSDYKGKVILVVNTATGCGFTPQYAPIEQLYKDYHNQGLEILDIPCNQFGGQAPGTDDEIHEFCTLHFNTTFPQMKKADVNGDWDKKPDIKWNFTKFVVNRDGEVVARFEPTADMAEVEACIKELL